MASLYDTQIETMQRLINYGMNENKHKNSQSVVEYHAEGADGKTYGIIREGHKFYIKSAPKKDTELLAEDYEYIGGFMNKKENEYLSYPMASKQLDLKLMSIAESCRTKAKLDAIMPKQKPSEWQIQETKEMRAELDRFAEITNNVSSIMNESGTKPFTINHTLPEAPAKNPSAEKVNAPFTDTAVAKLDKDLKDTQSNPEKAGTPYDENGVPTDKDMTSDKKNGGDGGDDTYSEKPKYVETGVAGQHPKGGIVVRANESKKHVVRNVVINEDAALAWSKELNKMDKSHGTEIGSSAPYSDQVPGDESNQGESGAEPIREEVAVHNTDNQNSPTPGNGEIGDDAPYDEKVNEEIIGIEDVAGFEDEADDVPFPEVEGGGAYLDFERDYNDFLDNEEGGIDFDLEVNDDGDYDFADSELPDSIVNIGDKNPLDPEEEEEEQFGESKVSEAVLNDFGKHPAYQKAPMTTPPNKEVLAGTADKDWNDVSAKGEEPYGKKIGSNAPYVDDATLDKIVDEIYKWMNKKKD